MKPLIFAALLAASATAAAAQAPPEGRHGPRGDRPPGEGGPPREHLFISPAGEPFRGPNGLAAWFNGADADHDGTLTLDEFKADALRFFRTLDTDHDGRLDGFELQAYERDVAPEITRMAFDEGGSGGGPRFGGMGGGGGRHGGGRGRGGGPEGGSRIPPGGGGAMRGGPGRQGAGRYGLLNIPEPVTNADEDIDGRVSLVEWNRAMSRRFAMLDKDGARKLTLEALRPPAPEKPAK